MARGRPIYRHVLRQITALGGFDRLEERLASGETIADLARTLSRPDGGPISRNFLSLVLHHDPIRSQRIKALRTEQAAAMVDDALHLVDRAPLDRDAVNKAKVQSDLRLRVAGFLDRQQWGEQKQQVSVQVNVESLHLDALRHRITEASRPLAEELGQVTPNRAAVGSGLALIGSGSNSGSVGVTRAQETQELA